MPGTVIGVLWGLLLTLLGAIVLSARRDSIEQTLLVKLADGELSFHARLHTPRDALNESDEGATIIYLSTSDIPISTFVIVKAISMCLIALGLTNIGQAVPAVADRVDMLDTLGPWLVHIAFALVFVFMALIFLRKRKDVADALSVLRVNPLGGLGDAAKESLKSAMSGENPLDSLLSQTISRAVTAATPVRAWAIVVPIFALATATELVLSQIFQ
jgi:hypothetical protein